MIFFKKLIRDFWSNKQTFISVMLMALLSMLLFMGLEGTYRGMDHSVNDFTRSQKLANGWLTVNNPSAEQVDQVKDLVGVDSVSTTKQIEARYQGKVLKISQNPEDISRVRLISGQKISNNRSGIWLYEKFAKDNRLKVGDHMTVSVNGERKTLRVNGTVLSPDDMYANVRADFPAPDAQHLGYGVAVDSTLFENAPTVIRWRGTTSSVVRQAQNIFGSQLMTVNTRQDNASVSTAFSRINQIKTLAYLFTSLFVCLAILSVFTSIQRVIKLQATDLNVLKSLGYNNGFLRTYYAALGSIPIIIGGAVGAMFAPIISLFVQTTQKQIVSLPVWHISYSYQSPTLFLGLVAITIAATFIASRSALAGLPAERKQKYNLHNGKANVKSQFLGMWQIRENLQNWVRPILSILGVVITMMLLAAGFGAQDTMQKQLDDTFGKFYHYDTKQQAMSADQSQRLDESSVKKQYFASSMVKISGEYYPLFVIGSGDYINTKHLGLKDNQITVTPAVSGNRQIQVAGSSAKQQVSVYRVNNLNVPKGVYVNEETYKKWMPISLSSYAFGRNTVSGVPKIQKSEQKATGQAMINGLNATFYMIQAFAIILGIVVLYNIGVMSFSERSKDYSTLNVLGMHIKEIQKRVFLENMLFTGIGIVIGWPFSQWFLATFISTFNDKINYYIPYLTVFHIVVMIVLVVAIGVLTTWLLGRSVNRLDKVQAIKGVEE